MSIVIRNLQRAVRINKHQLLLDSLLLKKICGYEDFELGVLLVTNNHIRKLNKNYRNLNEVTDVLAFPFHDVGSMRLDEVVKTTNIEEDERMLGDIVLALSYIRAESQKHGEELNSIILTMITHGICHLIGYDHETKEEWEQMYQKETDLLSKFNKITGHNCSPLLGIGH
ncbi:hypothetical protein Btru_059857 [Bulinus truncatus]|nr:hypothetical protein Btru_059857 [Bulinus truncatus]